MKKTMAILFTLLLAKAYTAPIKSNLGASATKNIEQTAPFENPYVSDGLVAMYDGEWNVGWGKHDATTRVWKNLATNLWDGSIGSGVKVGDNCMAFNGIRNQTNAVAIGSAWFGKPDSITIEVCYSRDGRGSQATEGVCGGSENSTYGGITHWCYSQYNWTIRLSSAQKIIGSKTASIGFNQSSLTISTNTCCVYYKGLLYSSIAGDTVDWTKRIRPFFIGCDAFNPTEYHMNGRVFCVRVYNRALTSEEVAHNYNIDKVRFGL